MTAAPTRLQFLNGDSIMSKAAAFAIGFAMLAGPALAQQPAMPGMSMPATPAMPAHPGMAMPTVSAGPAVSPSTKAFKAADDKMMRDMNRPMTGDADQDFVAGMLPHHQGAVDMAKVELQYGKDPEMRRLAQGIIAAQDKEIAQMQAWQKKHPKP
jgi:uncharacterized protein (DUF305 family)